MNDDSITIVVADWPKIVPDHAIAIVETERRTLDGSTRKTPTLPQPLGLDPSDVEWAQINGVDAFRREWFQRVCGYDLRPYSLMVMRNGKRVPVQSGDILCGSGRHLRVWVATVLHASGWRVLLDGLLFQGISADGSPIFGETYNLIMSTLDKRVARLRGTIRRAEKEIAEIEATRRAQWAGAQSPLQPRSSRVEVRARARKKTVVPPGDGHDR